ncbi:MlaE family ABC transporter permease [Nocardioides daeguensis]|uniref:ABC transporter permease n=1 Tax=Nocardioides daeguensis TaxID=908359 RepID=A0ABP6V6A5_9ACTN|nr:ABC transporter permease [Nocardioides daeguensis]MBV6726512.1 ABC transporter permease [Nocardioides daeguensis]MCR1772355.1 ABC transporter permease [Nocardioides daeguensis]
MTVESSAARRIRPVGPYDGRGSRLVGRLPGVVRGPVSEAGGMAQLLGRILRSAITQPRGYWGQVVEDMHVTIKRAWVPIVFALFGFLIFMSILTVQFFDMAGANQLFGPLLLLQSMRTFTIWIDSMVVAGVIGTALTSDVGARKVREEIDAMMVMGIDPVRDLAVPRVLSITFITTLLAVPSLLVTVFSMNVGGLYVASMPSEHFYSNLFSNVSPGSIVAVVVESFLIGLLIGTVCCYKGFTASGGAIGLGRSVNQAVVIAFLAVWVLQLAFNALLLGLFPNLGAFR